MTKITQDFYRSKSRNTVGRLSLLFHSLLFLPVLLFTLATNAQIKYIDLGGYTITAPGYESLASTSDINLALYGSAAFTTGSQSYPAGPKTIGSTAPYQLFTTDTATGRIYSNVPNQTAYSTGVLFPSLGGEFGNTVGFIKPNGNGGTSRTYSVFIPNGNTVTFILQSDLPSGTISINLKVSPATTYTPTNIGLHNQTIAYKITNSTGTDRTYTFYGSGKLSLYRVYFGDVSLPYDNAVKTTWSGSAWSNGTPTTGTEAIINGTYSGGAFNANKVTVNSGKSLTITSGSLTVQNEIKNDGGTVVLANNANLIQINNINPNPNTGNVTVKRNSNALLRLDYTLWSSPVASQNLADFSPLTSQVPSRFYNYNTTYNAGGVNGAYSAISSPATTNFTVGSGYLIRMPNTDPTSGYDTGSTALTFPGQFTGIPNNGDITVPLVDGGAAGLRFNLVGNPYPSPVNLFNFLNDNTTKIESTFYFWRKTNGTGTAYCTYVPTSTSAGTFVSNGNALSATPNSILQTGQGFFVEAKTGQTSILFRNTHRANNTTGQFFKIKQTAATGDKVWLNATNTAGDFSQTAVTYFEDAASGVDAFDGKYINDSSFALTSNISNEEYVIQGRPAFDASDVVPLNFKTATAGDYTIAIDHTEGVFANGQDVYLVDNTTGIETNLKSGNYTFTAPAGASNSRFALKYQKTLGVADTTFNESSVAVYKNKGVVNINSGAAAIANVKVYDIQGKLLAELKDVKSTSATINNLKAVNQVLVIQITLEDNTVITKKVVN